MDASAGFMIAITAAVVLVIILFNNKQVEDEFLTTENDEPNIVPDLIEIPSEEEIGWLKEDLRSARETEDKREEADLLNELGQIYLQLEKHEEALLYFQQAMDVEWEIGNRPGQCKNLASLAQTHTISRSTPESHRILPPAIRRYPPIARPQRRGHCT